MTYQQAAPYVLVAYMGMWLILGVYLVYQGWKLSKLEEEVRHLREVTQKKD